MGIREAGNYFGMILGVVAVALGGAKSVLYGFGGNPFGVYGGILLFMLGYKISYYSSKPSKRRRRYNDLKSHFQGEKEGRWIWIGRQIFTMVVGGGAIAYGIYLFSQTVIDPSFAGALLAGIVSFGGYIIAHSRMNKSVL